MSALVLLIMEWIFSPKAEAAVIPVNIKAGCKGREKTYDYLELRNSLIADVVNNVKIKPCMFKALMKILDTEQKVQAMTTTNFNRKQIIKSISSEIQRRNK